MNFLSVVRIKYVWLIFIWFFMICVTVYAREERVKISLSYAIERALEKNRSVIQSKNSIDVSRLNLQSTRADFDFKITPSAGAGITNGDEDISVGVSLTKRLSQGVDFSFSPGVGKGEDNYAGRVGLSLDIPLFKGRGELVNMAPVRGAEYSLRSARRALHRTRTNIIIQTVTLFYTIVEYQKKVELNTFLADRFKNHTALAKLKSDIGLASPLDVYRAEIKVKDTEADLADAMEALQNEKNELKSILSFSQDRKIELEKVSVKMETVDVDVHMAEKIALENSIDMRDSRDAFGEIQRFSKIARHNLLPDLKLRLDYSRAGASDVFEDAFSLNDDSWKVFLTSSTDFARTREKLSYRQSLIDIESSKIDLEDTKDQVKKNVRSQIDTLAKAEERILIRKEQIHQATGKKALAQIKFDNDMADNFDLIEAETELHRAKLNLLNAHIDYIIGTYRLREIMGTLLAYNEKN